MARPISAARERPCGGDETEGVAAGERHGCCSGRIISP
jgi:hypothetical protein